MRFTISTDDMARLQDAIQTGNDELAHVLFFEAYGMAAPDQIIGGGYSFTPA